MTKIILVRHATTSALLYASLSLRDDSETLCEYGQMEARLLAGRLSGAAQSVYSSPAQRAKETARLIVSGGTMHLCHELHEVRKGECCYVVYGRMRSAIDNIAPRCDSAVLVSHAAPIAIMLCAVLGMPLVKWRKIAITPASISVVEWHDGDARVLCLNDTSHLNIQPEIANFDDETISYIERP